MDDPTLAAALAEGLQSSRSLQSTSVLSSITQGSGSREQKPPRSSQSNINEYWNTQPLPGYPPAQQPSFTFFKPPQFYSFSPKKNQKNIVRLQKLHPAATAVGMMDKNPPMIVAPSEEEINRRDFAYELKTITSHSQQLRLLKNLTDYIRFYLGSYHGRYLIRDLDRLLKYPPKILLIPSNPLNRSLLEEEYAMVQSLVQELVEQFQAGGLNPLQWFDIITNWKKGLSRVMSLEEFQFGLTRFCNEKGLENWHPDESEMCFRYFLRDHQGFSEEDEEDDDEGQSDEEGTGGNRQQATRRLPQQQPLYIRRQDFKVGLKKLKIDFLPSPSNKTACMNNHLPSQQVTQPTAHPTADEDQSHGSGVGGGGSLAGSLAGSVAGGGSSNSHQLPLQPPQPFLLIQAELKARKKGSISHRRAHWLNHQATILQRLGDFLSHLQVSSLRDFCMKAVLQPTRKLTFTKLELESVISVVLSDYLIYQDYTKRMTQQQRREKRRAKRKQQREVEMLQSEGGGGGSQRKSKQQHSLLSRYPAVSQPAHQGVDDSSHFGHNGQDQGHHGGVAAGNLIEAYLARKEGHGHGHGHRYGQYGRHHSSQEEDEEEDDLTMDTHNHHSHSHHHKHHHHHRHHKKIVVVSGGLATPTNSLRKLRLRLLEEEEERSQATNKSSSKGQKDKKKADKQAKGAAGAGAGYVSDNASQSSADSSLFYHGPGGHGGHGGGIEDDMSSLGSIGSASLHTASNKQTASSSNGMKPNSATASAGIAALAGHVAMTVDTNHHPVAGSQHHEHVDGEEWWEEEEDDDLAAAVEEDGFASYDHHHHTTAFHHSPYHQRSMLLQQQQQGSSGYDHQRTHSLGSLGHLDMSALTAATSAYAATGGGTGSLAEGGSVGSMSPIKGSFNSGSNGNDRSSIRNSMISSLLLEDERKTLSILSSTIGLPHTKRKSIMDMSGLNIASSTNTGSTEALARRHSIFSRYTVLKAAGAGGGQQAGQSPSNAAGSPGGGGGGLLSGNNSFSFSELNSPMGGGGGGGGGGSFYGGVAASPSRAGQAKGGGGSFLKMIDNNIETSEEYLQDYRAFEQHMEAGKHKKMQAYKPITEAFDKRIAFARNRLSNLR